MLVHIGAGTEADLRLDERNGGAHVERQHRTRCVRMQADALADRHAHACADIDSYALADRHAHACADVHVRACSACAISCTLCAHGHRHAR